MRRKNCQSPFQVVLSGHSLDKEAWEFSGLIPNKV